MTHDIDWHRKRKEFIGASEAAAVLGRSPFNTPADIYWQKVATPDAARPTQPMKRGSRLEGVLIDYACERLGCSAERGLSTVVKGIQGATLDARLTTKRDEAIQAKTTTHPDEFGEEGTDEIPPYYLLQTQQEMHVCELRRVWVPVLVLAGFREEWRLYVVDRNEELGDEMERQLRAWWDRHVVAKVAPEGHEVPPLEVFKRLRREPESMVFAGANGVQAVNRMSAAREARKAAEQEEEDATRQVLSLMGIDQPAELLALSDGRTVEYRPRRSTPTCDFARMRAEFPDAYRTLVQQGEHRALRIKLPKGES